MIHRVRLFYSVSDWSRIGYHECTHDGTGGPCSWDENRENGTVPSSIPTMEAPA